MQVGAVIETEKETQNKSKELEHTRKEGHWRWWHPQDALTQGIWNCRGTLEGDADAMKIDEACQDILISVTSVIPSSISHYLLKVHFDSKAVSSVWVFGKSTKLVRNKDVHLVLKPQTRGKHDFRGREGSATRANKPPFRPEISTTTNHSAPQQSHPSILGASQLC